MQSGSGQRGGDPPPQTSTQAVLDPALLPLLHGVGLVGGAQHRHTTAPEGNKADTIKRCHLESEGRGRRLTSCLLTHLVQALLSSVGQTPM